MLNIFLCIQLLSCKLLGLVPIVISRYSNILRLFGIFNTRVPILHFVYEHLKIAEHQECNYFGNDKNNATISAMTKVIH
jgi:hypothetical protein